MPKSPRPQSASARNKRIPGRPVARISNVFEAIGALVLLVWGVASFPLGHPILAVVLLILGVLVAWVTVREFMGHGLGRAPTGSPEDSRN